MAVCFAPVCEELYFRGFVFQGLRRWVRFAWAGLASSAMFAFVHVEPIRFLSLCVTGLLFAGVFERRKTLVANMAAHATLNVIAITLAALAR
jgi:membrane protease YdiL (CAAX protease family)